MSKEYIEEILKSYYGLSPSLANSIPDLTDPVTCNPVHASTYSELVRLIPSIAAQISSSGSHVNWPISDLASALCKDSKRQTVNGAWTVALCGLGFMAMLIMCSVAYREWKRKRAEEKIRERLIKMEEAEARAAQGEGEGVGVKRSGV